MCLSLKGGVCAAEIINICSNHTQKKNACTLKHFKTTIKLY